MIVIIREWLNAEIKALYEVCWQRLYMSVQTQTLVQNVVLVPTLQFTHGLPGYLVAVQLFKSWLDVRLNLDSMSTMQNMQ